MPTRIPASERTSQKLDELLSQGVADGDARAELLKLAVRKIVEEALEAEVADAVGRGYYENGAPPGAGYRNGYRRGRLASAEGSIEYGVPQVADRVEPFVSRVRAGLAGRTAELERLAVEMFARGLSTRDIEAAFRGWCLGPSPRFPPPTAIARRRADDRDAGKEPALERGDSAYEAHPADHDPRS